MSLRPEALRGGRSGAGVIDYRLARRALISEYRKRRLAQHQVCDAHPELVRAARAIGFPARTRCPICETPPPEGTPPTVEEIPTLVHVIYVFGPKLPAHGRCIGDLRELAKLDKRRDPLMAYVVEVCPSCSWHHLVRTFPVGRAERAV